MYIHTRNQVEYESQINQEKKRREKNLKNLKKTKKTGEVEEESNLKSADFFFFLQARIHSAAAVFS